jgi:hypothetical protein
MGEVVGWQVSRLIPKMACSVGLGSGARIPNAEGFCARTVGYAESRPRLNARRVRKPKFDIAKREEAGPLMSSQPKGGTD